MRKVLPAVLVVGGIAALAFAHSSARADSGDGDLDASMGDRWSKDFAGLAGLEELAPEGDLVAGEILVDVKDEVGDLDPSLEDSAIARLAADPRVEHVEPMAIYRASFVPDDPLYQSKQW